MGGTFGAAVFGAILTSRLAIHLVEQFGVGAPAATSAGGSMTNNVEKIQQLPEPEHGRVLLAFADSLSDVFLWAIPVVLVALLVSFFIKELPLKAREPGPTGQGEAPEKVALAH